MIWTIFLMIIAGYGCAVAGEWLTRYLVRRRRRPSLNSQLSTLNPLSERELRAALRVDEDNPLWRAVQQCIGQQVEAAKQQVADVETQEKPQLLSYYAGGISVLEVLREFLVVEREKALAEIEEED